MSIHRIWNSLDSHVKRTGGLFALVISFCGVAHADLSDAIRYQQMHLELRQDGWNGTPAPSYYNALVQRVENNRSNQRLKRLKYYCEILPACSPRDVYVIMIWGAGGRFKPSELTKTNGYNRYDAVFNRLHVEGNIKGAYLIGFWDNYFARRDDDQSEHSPEEPWASWQGSGSPWSPGLGQLRTFISMIPRTSKLIVAGASLGGGTAATLAGILAQDNRPIDYLLLFDPVGIYGWRREAIAHPIPANVRRFFNIWQEQGCWPVEYLLSGRFRIANPQYTKARQELFTGGSDAGPCIDSVSKSVHSETWRHVRPSDGVQRISYELLSAINSVTAPPPHIDQSHWIDGSKVTVKSKDGANPDVALFELSTSMAWWTGIRIHRVNGSPYLIEREHGTGPYNVVTGSMLRNRKSISIPISDLAERVKIEFWTAKLFGVHTYMAETVINRDESRGRVVQVKWPTP